MNIELRQLRYFLAVAQELHFGKAALHLHMTQPPLSQTIMALEEALGCALFVRSRRGVSLTPAGSALLPQARQMLEQAQQLPELVMRAANGEIGQLALAFVSSADYSVLPPFLRAYRSAFPRVKISLQEATSDWQLTQLQAGRIDAGLLLAPLPEKANIALDYWPVLSEPLILAAPSGLAALARLGKTQAVQLSALPAMPLIIFPRAIAPALYDSILMLFHTAGITPEIGQQAIQMQTIVSLVSAGMGYALVPQSVSNLMRPGVEYRALADATLQVETGLAWRRDNQSPVLSGFLKLLRENTPC